MRWIKQRLMFRSTRRFSFMRLTCSFFLLEFLPPRVPCKESVHNNVTIDHFWLDYLYIADESLRTAHLVELIVVAKPVGHLVLYRSPLGYCSGEETSESRFGSNEAVPPLSCDGKLPKKSLPGINAITASASKCLALALPSLLNTSYDGHTRSQLSPFGICQHIDARIAIRRRRTRCSTVWE